MRARWIGMIVTSLLAIVFAVAVLQRGDGPQRPARQDAQETSRELAAAEPPSPAPRAVERVPVAWVPDGAIWVRLVDARDGSVVRDARVEVSWGEHQDRWFLPGDEAVSRRGDYLRIAAAAPGQDCLAIAAAGFAVAHLPDPDPAVRHDVSLRDEGCVRLLVGDVETAEVLGGVNVRLSRADLRGVDWVDGGMPGVGDDAVFFGRSDDDGVVVLRGMEHGADYHVAVREPHYMLAAEQEGRVRAAWHVRLRLQMPLVWAVKYVGDEFVDGGLRMRAFASSRPSVRNELEERRARIAREHGAHLTALALPDQAARARGDFTARVSARFRGAPEREDRVEAVRLDAFRGPVELAVESGPGGTSMGQLVLVAPERDRAFAQEIEFIILDRTSGKPGPRRKARLGEQVALPEGRYDVWPMRRGARKAFAKATVDIVGSQVAELPLEWAAGVVLHEVRCREAATGRPCGRGYAQLVVEVPGKGHGVFDAMRDRDGVARFWLPHEVTSAELCNSGWQRQDIEFSATPRAGVVAAEVALEPIVGEAGK